MQDSNVSIFCPTYEGIVKSEIYEEIQACSLFRVLRFIGANYILIIPHLNFDTALSSRHFYVSSHLSYLCALGT
jgi:hypothetical protein